MPTTIIGSLTLACIVALLRTPWRRFAFILAIGGSTALLAVLTHPAVSLGSGWQAVRTVGSIASIPRTLPRLAVPAPRFLPSMLLPALAVASIGLIQGAGISHGYPNPDGRYPDVSRDFLGQGAANIAASLVGGLPAGGSISGTVLNMSTGARSRWTNILGGLFVALIVLLAAPLVAFVPMPSLAALLIVAGFQGLRIEPAIAIWNTGTISRAVMVTTFVATLFIPLQYAVLLGVAASIVTHVARQSNQVVVTRLVPVPDGFPEERPAPEVLPSGQVTVLLIYGSLFFAAAKSLEEILPAADKASRAVVALVLRGRAEVGSTFIAVLRRYAEELSARDNRLMLVGIDKAVYDQLARTGVLDSIGDANIFFATPQLGEAVNQAVEAAHAWLEADPRVTVV